MDAALRNMVGYPTAEWSHYDDMPTVHHTKQIHVYLKNCFIIDAIHSSRMGETAL